MFRENKGFDLNLQGQRPTFMLDYNNNRSSALSANFMLVSARQTRNKRWVPQSPILCVIWWPGFEVTFCLSGAPDARQKTAENSDAVSGLLWLLA